MTRREIRERAIRDLYLAAVQIHAANGVTMALPARFDDDEEMQAALYRPEQADSSAPAQLVKRRCGSASS